MRWPDKSVRGFEVGRTYRGNKQKSGDFVVTWEEAAALRSKLEAAAAAAQKVKSATAAAAKKARAAATESALHQLHHAAGQNRYDDGTFQAKPAANATPRTCPANNKRKHLDWTSKKGSKSCRSVSGAVYIVSSMFVWLYAYLMIAA